MTRNGLLKDLAGNEAAVLTPRLQEVVIERGRLLAEAGDSLQHVYFPVEGVLPFVCATEDGATVEAADVGCEGVATVAAILGSRRLPLLSIKNVETLRRECCECYATIRGGAAPAASRV